MASIKTQIKRSRIGRDCCYEIEGFNSDSQNDLQFFASFLIHISHKKNVFAEIRSRIITVDDIKIVHMHQKPRKKFEMSFMRMQILIEKLADISKLFENRSVKLYFFDSKVKWCEFVEMDNKQLKQSLNNNTLLAHVTFGDTDNPLITFKTENEYLLAILRESI